jgi:hypothetical protein
MSDGYVSAEARARLQLHFRNRCAYCLAPQSLIYAPLEVEHILPRVKGGDSREENLCLSCPTCNCYKTAQTEAVDPVTGSKLPLFNPRHDRWADHFSWSNDGIQILGLTATERATVVALRMNNVIVVDARRAWVCVGWHPPSELS